MPGPPARETASVREVPPILAVPLLPVVARLMCTLAVCVRHPLLIEVDQLTAPTASAGHTPPPSPPVALVIAARAFTLAGLSLVQFPAASNCSGSSSA